MQSAKTGRADGAAEELKAAVAAEFGRHEAELFELVVQLHDEPETAWQEFRSMERILALTEPSGFVAERGVGGIATAFRASPDGRGSRAAHVGDAPMAWCWAGDGARPGSTADRLFRAALVAEYDALPGLGHACGHNLIAAVSVGAALALVPVLPQLPLTLQLIGTPAEEGGGGKLRLLDGGVFDGLDAALMVHPGPVDALTARALATSHLEIEYTGVGSHAGTYPERGRNAADAFVIAQTAIGLLRQSMPVGTRVHGIVTEAGVAPNAVPASARGRWYVRAQTLDELIALEARVVACFEAGATATGCTAHIRHESGRYANFRNDERLLSLFAANSAAIGRPMQDADGDVAASMALASTDMGNVSQRVPAIHPYLGLDCFPIVNHQQEFADVTISESGRRLLRDGVLALAGTLIDASLTFRGEGLLSH